MLDKKQWARRHNIVLRHADLRAPLSLGNGSFAFSADITGFQTLKNDYAAPLCTMSERGYHTYPEAASYALNDIEHTEYELYGRKTSYPQRIFPQSEKIYNFLRKNPHKFNLARVFLCAKDGREIKLADITQIHQTLDLYTGKLKSAFNIFGCAAQTFVCCAKSADALCFGIKARGVKIEDILCVKIAFAYPSHKISGADYEKEALHSSILQKTGQNRFCVKRIADCGEPLYYTVINGAGALSAGAPHVFLIKPAGEFFTVAFYFEEPNVFYEPDFIIADSEKHWRRFWLSGGAADFSNAEFQGAFELERRTALSRYLTAAHCAGNLPPAETGHFCNSWYGKFHLEMHLLHAAHFPLWSNADYLERSFEYYFNILDAARQSAASNGFSGARWPKMTDKTGLNAPSTIAPLLIWQQPHIIYMLEITRRTKPAASRRAFMEKYWPLVRETAEFMVSFVLRDGLTGKFFLPPPIIPVQETHAAENVKNPFFELSYWRCALGAAVKWAKRLNAPYANLQNVRDNLSDLPVINGLYPAHENCSDTFCAHNRDHPSMLFSYGLIKDARVNKSIMAKTVRKVLSVWNYSSLWGWDFAMCAMTLARLGQSQAAVETLLMDSPKNAFLANGNNFQIGRDDLPAYYPGNGALLLAVGAIFAGFKRAGGAADIEKQAARGVQTADIYPLPLIN